MNLKLLLYFFILMPGIGISQVTEEWVKRYNGPGNSFDIVSNMLTDSYGNVYVYGSSVGDGSLTDFAIVKYNSNGSESRVCRYNGTGNSTDQLNSAAMDLSGNSYVTGFTTDTSMNNVFTTAKFDSSGNLIWIKFFYRQGYSSGTGQSIALDGMGNVAVTGYMRNETGFYDIAVIKYSQSGNELLSVFYSGNSAGNNIPVTLKTDNLNNIIITGTSKNSAGSQDILVLKYDNILNLIWTKYFNGTANLDDLASDLDIDSGNNIFVCGSVYNTSSLFDYFLAEISTDGNVLWTQNFDGEGNNMDYAYSVALDNEYIFITGSSRNGTLIGTEDIVTIKKSKSGGTIWTSVFNGNANGSDQGISILPDDAGGVFVGGASDRGGNQMTYALLKYDSSGKLSWKKDYSTSDHPEDFVYCVVKDNLDNIYVTGISISTLTDYDFATIKYSPLVSTGTNESSLSEKFSIDQNYPNPFNSKTKMNYTLPADSRVLIEVFDILGKKIATLVNDRKSEGNYSVIFDSENIPGGIYFYKLTANGVLMETRRMSLVK